MPPDQEKKKPRAKDIYGRPLPTEEEFEVLKNAPRYVLFSFRADNQIIKLFEI